MKTSLEARFLLIAAGCALTGLFSGVLATAITESIGIGIVFAATVTIPLTVLFTRRAMGSVNRILQALNDNVASFKDGDFSVSLGTDRDDELGQLVQSFNEVGDALRRERQNLFQRELLLDTVIQSTTTALVLTDDADHVVFTNIAARRLFFDGRRMDGFTFRELLAERRPEFLQGVRDGTDGLFAVETADEEEVFHLSHSHFALNTRPHRLYLFKQLTRELTRQEVATWKKVIRVISHELNNSLAPISSLAHSGRELARRGDTARLESVFGSIEERASYLKQFIEGYARFAKLPAPQIEAVPWRAFFESVGEMSGFTLIGTLPAEPGWFDPVQMQQVMLNLLKNAEESGCTRDEIEVEVHDGPARTRFDVRDRGTGMSENVLHHALLPFYSTKKSGTGLGLSLCREIIEAHGGRVSIANRSGGGLEVSFWLPKGPVNVTPPA
ncbi:MAG TPA: ATP-binding protein [Gammaproteobacteria bacterium]